MAGEAQPSVRLTHPGLRHRHHEGLGLTCADVHPISHDAPQDSRVTYDAYVGIVQHLAVPLVRAAPVRLEIGLQIEPVTLMRHPAEAGMQKLSQAVLITTCHRLGTAD